MRHRDLVIACTIFAAVFVLLLATAGNRLTLTTDDEGIYLDAGERMLHGERLYSDFFGYMSPGVFVVQELSFRALGVTMVAGRLPVLIYFAAECALLFWLTARLGSHSLAWAAVLLFFALQTIDMSFLTAQHRWDSGAMALASMALAVHGHSSKGRWPWAAAGALGALSAFFTPSLSLLPGLTLVWLGVLRSLRPNTAPYLAGAAAAGAMIVLLMAGSGMLWPFVEQMRWLSRHYSGINRMPYGAPVGGYRLLLSRPLDATLSSRVVYALFLTLPASLPVLSLAGWAAAFAFRLPGVPKAPRRHAILYVLGCSVALAASTWPRPDLMHLGWVAPVSFVTAAALLSFASRLVRDAALILLGMFGVVFAVFSVRGLFGADALVTPVGTVRVAPNSAASVQALLDVVKPGDSAFVHPYKPVLYFLTQTKNPTRYSFLAPGMMTGLDEQSALRDLRRSPPQWVMLGRVTPESFLRIFPGADPAQVHFGEIESWIDSHYAPVSPAVELAGYRLLRFVGGEDGR